MAQTELHKFTVQEKLNKMDIDVITINPAVTTAECVVGDVIFQGDEIENAVAIGGGAAILQSVTLLDDDDHGQAIDLVFSSGSGDLDGTAAGGTAIDVDDDSSSVPGSVLGIVTISNYFDGINWKIGTTKNIGLVLKAASDSRSIYVSAVNRGGTKTWTASGLHLKIGLVRD